MKPLRPFLSSREMLIVLDNAESILDPQGTNHEEIYSAVDELCQFRNVCVCITSRITTIPRHCKRPKIPTLSMEAACDIFYGIYGGDGRSGIIENLLQRLDFHALSITLLATTASENSWSYDRLAEEWGLHHSQVLPTDHNESLAATIELSLTSPTFRKLGPSARHLLSTIAFFPQGIDEKNLEWLFPTISDRRTIFDKFCLLSLAYRTNNLVTMLAPIRDYLYPRDPKSSPLLCAAKDRYFARLSADLNPNKPEFGDARWIMSEDVNVEHLLHVFTPVDMDGLDVWDAFAHFMDHLYWQKPRQTTLGSKIEGLPDDHPSKAKCLFMLSRLFGSTGNEEEQKRLLIHTLSLERQRGDDSGVAVILSSLSHVNRILGHTGEGIRQVKEELRIFERLGDTQGQAACLHDLAWLLLVDEQLDAAEDAALRKMEFLPEKGEECQLCQSHRILGLIYRSKGERAKAMHHFETALTIASLFRWQDVLFWIHYAMAELFFTDHEFGDANTHIEQAISYTADDAYSLGCGVEMQAWIWYRQERVEDARSEALRALGVYEKLGAAKDVGDCRQLLRQLEKATGSQIPDELDSGGEFLAHNAASHNR